jgi:hypothetical protein
MQDLGAPKKLHLLTQTTIAWQARPTGKVALSLIWSEILYCPAIGRFNLPG